MTYAKYKRANYPSPHYPATSGSIAASGSWIYDYESSQSATQKYLPFNFVTVTNNSNVSIKFYPNQLSAYAQIIPSGVIRTYDKRSIPAFHSFKIVNLSASTGISANEVEIVAWRTAYDEDDLILSIHKKVMGLVYGY